MNSIGKRAVTIAVLGAAGLVAACNTPDALNLRGVAPPAAVAEAEPSEATTAMPLAAVPAGSARIQIAPVVGAPAPALGPLSARLSERAAQKQFAVVTQGDASATHTLKGFFSASPEGNQTTVFYVWDVIDKGGNRVHRFSGEQAAPGASTDGWSVVTEATMQAIADRTADDLGAWLAGAAG
jgi:hypothetical protein